VAFFLVTIELYGETRLREFHENFVPFLQKVKLMHERSTDHELVASPFFIVVSILIFIVAYKIRPYLGLPLADPDHKFNDFWQGLFVVGGYFLLGFVWVILVIFPLNWVMVGVHWLARLNLFLLNKLQLKGLLLSIGAVMFVFAKLILAFHVLPETGLYHFFRHTPE
jgi:hypothetical protein